MASTLIPMITYPNCKINIGLHVTSKRPDGYHNLESVFVPVPLCDTLTIEPSSTFKFTQSGILIDGDAESNLCVKAYRMLQKDFPNIEPVHIHLEKIIPFGAGLGGGSSDAAFTIGMINELFSLNLSTSQMEDYARQLGADCAFFVQNRPMYAHERGDVLEPFDLNINKYTLALIKPDFGVSTAEAYRGLTPMPGKVDLRQALLQPIAEWKSSVVNHFEAQVFPLHPELSSIKDLLYQCGALYASMSGSGSTIYGIFNHEPSIPPIPNATTYIIMDGKTL